MGSEKFIRRSLQRTIIAVALLSAACSGGGGGSDDSSGGSDGDFSSGGGTVQRDAIDNYINGFILPTLRDLESDANRLETSVRSLASSRTAANLAAARTIWVETRVPWEQKETALFGPVDFFGFDPALDSWPVNKVDLDGVLGSGIALTPESVSNLDNSLKGFHTIEYLLFGNGGTKQVGDITDREAEYLVATTIDLSNVASELRIAWTDGTRGQGPYAAEVALAGQGSTTFPSEQSALEQFVRGMIVICDEVANGKIADPFDTRNPEIVESQFSFNSVADFANNVRGASNAYDASVSAVVRSKNVGADTRIKAAYANAIAAVEAIPQPFRSAILDPANDSKIIAAQRAVREVQRLLEQEILPLVTS